MALSTKDIQDALAPFSETVKELRAETRKVAEWCADIEAGRPALSRAAQKTAETAGRQGYADPYEVALREQWLKLSIKRQVPGLAASVDPEEFRRLTAQLSGRSKAYLNENTSAQGAYAVPTDLGDELFRVIEDNGLARKLARRLQINTKTTNLVSIASNVTTYVVAEMGSAITQGEPAFGQKVLTAKDFVAYGQASVDVLQDEVIGLLNFFMVNAGEQIAAKEDAAMLEGTSGDPAFVGIGAQTTTSTYTIDKCFYSAVTTATNAPLVPTISQLAVAAFSPLHKSSRLRAAWVMRPEAWANIVSQTSSSLPVFGNVAFATVTPPADSDGSLFGYPVYCSANIANVTAGSNIFFGNFGHGFMLADRGGFDFQVSEHEKFQYGLVSMRLIKRTAGVCAVPSDFAITAKVKATFS